MLNFVLQTNQMALVILIFFVVTFFLILNSKKASKHVKKSIVKQHELNGSQIKTFIEPILSSKDTTLKKPEMAKQNKWLHPEDDLGELERGVN